MKIATRSLSVKLILAFMGVAAAAIAAVSLIQAQRVGSALIADSGELLHARAESEARLISSAIDAQITRLNGIAIGPSLRSAATTHIARYPLDDNDAARQIAAEDARWPDAEPSEALIDQVLNTPLAAELRAQTRLDDNIAELMFTDRRGSLVAANARTTDYNQADEEWWQRAAADGIYVSTPTFDKSSGSFSVIIATAVFDQNSGVFIGVLRSTYRTSALTLRLAGDNFGTATRALLVIDGQALKPGGTRLVALTEADAGAVAQAHSSNYALANYENLPRLIALAAVPNRHLVADASWAVLLYQDRSEALAPVSSAQNSTLITALIVLAAAVLVAVFISELISAPIRQITAGAEQIAAGDLGTRIGSYGADEIGRLARGFDQMAASLQERIDAEHAAQAERTHMQQAMIAAQERHIEELTTPTIPLGHGTLLLPLIGSLNQQRAEHMLITILADVHARRAHTLILDLSGMREVDAQVMKVLMQAAAGVRLIGASVILVGIRAHTARTLADLDVDLAGIPSYASLQDALDVL